MAHTRDQTTYNCGQCQHFSFRHYMCDREMVPIYKEPENDCPHFICVCGGNARDGFDHSKCFEWVIDMEDE